MVKHNITVTWNGTMNNTYIDAATKIGAYAPK